MVVYAVTVGNTLSGCDDLGHGLASERLERRARTDQHDRPDRTEPALANEHAESTEATEPTEPTDKIDPAEPASRRERSSFRMKLFSQPGRNSREAQRSRSIRRLLRAVAIASAAARRSATSERYRLRTIDGI